MLYRSPFAQIQNDVLSQQRRVRIPHTGKQFFWMWRDGGGGEEEGGGGRGEEEEGKRKRGGGGGGVKEGRERRCKRIVCCLGEFLAPFS